MDSVIRHNLDSFAWQFIACTAIIIILDPLVYMKNDRVMALRSINFNAVMYFTSTSTIILVFCLITNLLFGNTSASLLYVAQILWSIGLMRMLLTYQTHYLFSVFLITFIILGTVFYILDGTKVINLLDEMDLAMGFKPDVSAAKDKNSAGGSIFGGLRDKIYMKPSQLLLFVFYFVYIALPFHYFGTAYRLYRASIRAKGKREHIHEDALVKSITVFSLIASTMISFILCGADIFQIGLVTAILGAGFSIAAKELISNFAAGIVLMWDNSIKRDDVITVDGRGYGWVDEISMRYTKIIDRNEMNVLIPNLQLINGRIENWTQSNNYVRLKLDVEVSYETNLKHAMEIMMDCCYHVPRVLRHAPHRPNALVFATEQSGVKLQLRFWISDPKSGIRNVTSDVYLYILDRFAQAIPRIDVPFNQLEVRRIIPDLERPIKN